MIPIRDLFGQPVLHGGWDGPVTSLTATRTLRDAWNKVRDRGPTTDSGRLSQPEIPALRSDRPVLPVSQPDSQVRGVAGVCGACGIRLNELELPGDHAAVTGLVGAAVLDGVLQVEERADCVTRIVGVHQHRAALQEVSIALQDEIDRSAEEWLAGTDECGQRLAGTRAQGLLESDPFIFTQHWLTGPDQAVPLAD